MSLLDFTDIKDDFATIPQGTYPAYVSAASFKESQAGTEYLNLQFKIFGPEHDGRVVFSIYNLFHAKDMVKNIAMSDLKKLMLASGFDESAMKFESKEALLELVLECRCKIKLAIKTSSDYGDQNVIKGYSPIADGEVESSPF